MTNNDVVVTVKQLSLQPGDIVLIQFDSVEMSAVKASAIRNALLPDVLTRKASLVMIPNDCQVDKVNAHYMEQQGWIRKGQTNA